MSDIYLVRHGQASFDADDYDQLSAAGHEQSALLARHFVALDRRIDAVYSGPLRRQRETAEGFAAGYAARSGAAIQPTLLDGLAEYDADRLVRQYLQTRDGPAAATRKPDRAGYQALLEATGKAWIGGELAGEVESFATFRDRVVEALGAIRGREGRGRAILAAVSAGVMGVLVGHVLGVADREALGLSWVVYNSAVTVLRYDDRRMALSSFNGVAHLEGAARLDLLTYR